MTDKTNYYTLKRVFRPEGLAEDVVDSGLSVPLEVLDNSVINHIFEKHVRGNDGVYAQARGPEDDQKVQQYIVQKGQIRSYQLDEQTAKRHFSL